MMWTTKKTTVVSTTTTVNGKVTASASTAEGDTTELDAALEELSRVVGKSSDEFSAAMKKVTEAAERAAKATQHKGNGT